jgi:hypothetical protein
MRFGADLPLISITTTMSRDSSDPMIFYYETEVRHKGRSYHFRQWFRGEEFLIQSFHEHLIRAQLEGIKEHISNDTSIFGDRIQRDT